MKTVFADTGYWIALVKPGDPLHPKAIATARALGAVRIVTSELVLVELLNTFAASGSYLRRLAGDMVLTIQRDPNVEVVAMTSAGFERARDLYCSRPDKGWSLTDCASFQIMNDRGIIEALAADHHFEQAGFRAMLR